MREAYCVCLCEIVCGLLHVFLYCVLVSVTLTHMRACIYVYKEEGKGTRTQKGKET